MQRDKQFLRVNDWALASDGIQWILSKRDGKNTWKGTSFVRTTKEIMARCMHEKGVPVEDATWLLEPLPDTFDEWITNKRVLRAHMNVKTSPYTKIALAA